MIQCSGAVPAIQQLNQVPACMAVIIAATMAGWQERERGVEQNMGMEGVQNERESRGSLNRDTEDGRERETGTQSYLLIITHSSCPH